jgi:hypothetical protein
MLLLFELDNVHVYGMEDGIHDVSHGQQAVADNAAENGSLARVGLLAFSHFTGPRR